MLRSTGAVGLAGKSGGWGDGRECGRCGRLGGRDPCQPYAEAGKPVSCRYPSKACLGPNDSRLRSQSVRPSEAPGVLTKLFRFYFWVFVGRKPCFGQVASLTCGVGWLAVVTDQCAMGVAVVACVHPYVWCDRTPPHPPSEPIPHPRSAAANPRSSRSHTGRG